VKDVPIGAIIFLIAVSAVVLYIPFSFRETFLADYNTRLMSGYEICVEPTLDTLYIICTGMNVVVVIFGYIIFHYTRGEKK
jgi:hypothetical protein